jgi:hypothetical protein
VAGLRGYRHAMVRVALVIGVLAIGLVLFKQRSDEAGAGAAAVPTVSTVGMPKEIRALIADRPDPMQMLRRRGALPGMGSIRRLAGSLGGGAEPAKAPMRPFADVGSRRDLRKVRGDIHRDFAALNRLSSMEGGATIAQVSRTLAEVYSAPVLAALGADGVREFAERYAGRTEVAQKVKILDFEGVFVSGRRALAQIVYRLSLRAPSGHFVARAPATWTVTLAREGGRWRFVQGLET